MCILHFKPILLLFTDLEEHHFKKKKQLLPNLLEVCHFFIIIMTGLSNRCALLRKTLLNKFTCRVHQYFP